MSELSGLEGSIIGVVGTGTLGTQIAAHVLCQGGSVIIKTRSSEKIGSINDRIGKLVSKYPNKSKPVGDLMIVTDYCDLANCAAVIEAVIEDQEAKISVLKAVEMNIRNDAFLLTNSSSISIDTLASGLMRPMNFLGFHLFNPVARMNLVEIILGKHTSDKTVNFTLGLAKAMGKDPVLVNNRPGFIVNRLLLWQINEAAKMVTEGVSTVTDIDKAVRLGLNHPMGPFQLADLIGLDVCLSILNTLHQDLGLPGYQPSILIRTMVEEGRLGKKTGLGFYDYPNNKL